MYITASSSAFGTIPKFTQNLFLSLVHNSIPSFSNEIKREKDIIKIDQRSKTFCINFKKTEIDLDFPKIRREKVFRFEERRKKSLLEYNKGFLSFD